MFGGSPALAGMPNTHRASDHTRRMWSAFALGGAFVVWNVGRDLFAQPSGQSRLAQLFTYNYTRAFPTTLDFSGVLLAFTILGVAIYVLLASDRTRKVAVGAMLVLSLVWAFWGLDVYMVRVAPHWGQHDLVEAYYRARKGPEEPLVGYRMNWKGENFYTGNDIPMFEVPGASDPIGAWVKKRVAGGTKVMFFITEPGNVAMLRGEVHPRALEELTDMSVSNKFVVVRTEL
jgi:hypothetical protein